MRKIAAVSLLLLFCTGTTLFAQTEVMKLSRKTLRGLTPRQKENGKKITDRGMYKNYYLVETTPLPAVTKDNNIVLNLPFLPCGSLSYILTGADSTGTDSTTTPDTYVWSGMALLDPAKYSQCTYGEITLVNHRGVFAGTFTIDDKGYELFDLGEGLQAVAELDYSSEKLRNGLCGTANRPPQPPPQGPPPADCDQIKTKVLVLYTDKALNAVAESMPGTAISSIAHLGIAQLNATLVTAASTTR